MKSTKDGEVAIKELISSGGAMGISIGDTNTFHIGEAAELIEMGFRDTRKSTITAINVAIAKWSLESLNEELGAGGHYSCHTEVSEAREALVNLLMEYFVPEPYKLDQYRYENGTLYELRGDSYVCCFKSLAKTKKAAICEYERL
jgi:hypothetical protein